VPPQVIPEPLPPEGELRPLLPQVLTGVLGVNRVLVPELPLEGGPLLAADAEGMPVVVSFDHGDGRSALLAGATAVEALSERSGWLARMCPHIPADMPIDAVRLLVLAPRVGDGVGLLATGNQRVSLAVLSALRVNGELVLMASPWQGPNGSATATHADGTATAATDGHPFRTGQVTLSDDEEAFFRSL